MTEKKETPETEIETKIECKDIHAAINEVYKRVGYVAKMGKVDMGNNRSYKFAGEAEFIAAIRPEMAELGIYQQPYNVNIVTNERIESEKEWNGKVTKTYQHRAVIQTVYRFTHKESGTFVDVTAIGEGMDSGDKAFNKAMTGANKYALRQLFMIETGDDPDKYASDENGGVSSDGIITTAQAVEIDLLITETKANKVEFLKYCGVDDVRKIPLSKHKTVLKMLNKKKDNKNG